MYFSQDEYERRWSATLKEMERRGYEAAVIWSRSGGTHDNCGDVLWLTNFYSPGSGSEPDSIAGVGRPWSAVILLPGREPLLHVPAPPRMENIAVSEAPWHRNIAEGLAEAIRQEGIEGKVAMCGTNYLPVKYANIVSEALPGVEFVPEDDLVKVVRRVKSLAELDCYREAGTVVSGAMDLLFERLLNGATEAEAAGATAEYLMSRGGNFHMIPISHGDHIEEFCSDPLNGYSTAAPEEGDLVRAWIYGPIWQGYWLDPGRTAVVGSKPSGEQPQLIEATAKIVEDCIAAVKPGVTPAEIAEIGEKTKQAAGGGHDQASEMWPLFGHGVGISWEDPLLAVGTDDGDQPIEEGMVLGVEAFLSKDGVGAAGFEQNIIVTASGSELLTQTPLIL